MNPLIQLKKATSVFLVAFGLACFGLSPKAQAVLPSPTPDGGYPGNNTAEGTHALFSLTTGTQNTANGYYALFNNTTGGFNTGVGARALVNNTTGDFNTADGAEVLFHNTTGGGNTAVGYHALLNNDGSSNIALGDSAGTALTTGSNNIDIGNPGVAGESDKIRIGRVGTQTATFVAGIHGVAVTGSAVVVNTSGQLGVAPSSEQFKQSVQDMGDASDALLALRPVTFRYKHELDPKGVAQFGLVAEEVEKVNPALITRDADGKPYTVRYEAVNAMLLNEFLKEHRQAQEQKATIVELKSMVKQQQKQIEALTGGLQKVSAQLNASKSAPQVVNNNQ
jgi:hypothetical protein